MNSETSIHLQVNEYLTCRWPPRSRQAVFWHTPNEWGTRKPPRREAGVLPGVPDFIVAWHNASRSGTSYIELKGPKGRQTKSQKDFQSRIEAIGYPYHVCRNAEEVEAALDADGAPAGRGRIRSYLKPPRPR